jgi:DNA-binding MarR family transcriptional regulator
LTDQGLTAWVSFLRSHAALIRELNAQLQAEHGLTINDYEVLLHLSQAENRSLRRVDLSERVLLTASGITRLLDGLERAGWVEKGQCKSDARVTYAVLTDAGYEKLRDAGDFHVEGVRRAFAANYTEAELATLGELLGRLADGDGGSCQAD